MKLAICDDEPLQLQKIQSLIEQYNTYPLSIVCFTSGVTLLKSNLLFDAYLLDIDMPELNGIEIAKRLRLIAPTIPIIYLTNYPDYVFPAFSVHAFAYLLKPIDSATLYKQLDELHLYENRQHMHDKNSSVSERSNSEVISRPPLLSFETTTGLIRLPVHSIYYFEYQRRLVYLHSSTGIYTLHEKIGTIAARMHPYHFEMPHKSFTVNLYHIKSIHGYEVAMMNGDQVPLSQKKSALFRRILNTYLHNERED